MREERNKRGLTRRKFLVGSAVGVGVILGVGYLSRSMIRRYLAGIANTIELPYQGDTDSPSIWFEVLADNRVILHSPKVEMGQGTFTGLAQMAADELEVEMSQMVVVHAATSTGNIDPFATGGSNSISSLWIPLRELAATMREMLRGEAAKMLGVDPANLSIRSGRFLGGGRQITYGDVVSSVEEWHVPETPPLKVTADFNYIGKPVPRIDLRDKVMGMRMFGMDSIMEDMLYGAVARPVHIGARFVSVDTSIAENMPEVVRVVVEKDFAGVIAKSRVAAHQAKEALVVEWEYDDNWQTEAIEKMIRVGQGNPVEIQKDGNPEKLLSSGENIITREYTSPIGAHAQLEPNGAVALVSEEGAVIMISTQVVAITRKEIAQRLGMSEDQVNVIPTYLGGGFGRRLHTPNAVQAAVLSKAVGRPVKCFFDRKEEFQNDTFRPPTHHVLKARLDDEGRILAMEHQLSSGDVMFGSPMFPRIATPLLGADAGVWRGGMIQYGAIPNHRAVCWRVKLPFATSWWRSLGLLANTFAIECFMDELALKTGKDPAEFRLAHIEDNERGTRLKEVIRTVVEKSQYRDDILPNGRAMGLAASTDANTPCAQVVEVSLQDKEIKVHKVTCVIDPGLVINPDQVRAQCEGAIIMGLSAALYEKMEVRDSQLTPTIYGPYRMAMMRDAPREIDVVILQNDDQPGAVGEPPLGPIGAAIANALFRLTGERQRAMPVMA